MMNDLIFTTGIDCARRSFGNAELVVYMGERALHELLNSDRERWDYGPTRSPLAARHYRGTPVYVVKGYNTEDHFHVAPVSREVPVR